MFGCKIIKKTEYNEMLRQIGQLRMQRDTLIEEAEKLNRGIIGGRYCQYCKYGREVFSSILPLGKDYLCCLTIPCEKFEEKEEKGGPEN